jgi:hypothetical protein
VCGEGVLRLAGVELTAQAVFDVVRGFAEDAFDFIVVSLFRAAAVRMRGDEPGRPDKSAGTRGVTSVVVCGGEGAGVCGGEGAGARGGFVRVAPGTWGAIKGRGGDNSFKGVGSAEVEGGGFQIVREGVKDFVLIERETT